MGYTDFRLLNKPDDFMKTEPNKEVAERIKELIKLNGGYDTISSLIGVHSQTLLRIAGGKTEPKFRDIIALASCTGSSINYIAFGQQEQPNQEIEAVIDELLQQKVNFVEAELQQKILVSEYDRSEIQSMSKRYNLLSKELEEVSHRLTEMKVTETLLEKMESYDQKLAELTEHVQKSK